MALGPAELAQVIRVGSDGGIVFSHPLYAAAVYESTPIARRRALHRQLAGVVGEPDEKARHLALATTAPDEDVARMLEDGARQARTRGAWQSAAELLEQARAFTPTDRSDDAVRRGIAAAEHHAHAGDRGRASSLLEGLIERLSAGPLRADALRLLGEVRYNAESFREAVRLFEEAAQNATDPGLLTEIKLDLAYAAYQASPDQLAAIAAHVERALELAASSGDGGLYAQALALHTLSEYLLGRGLSWDRLEQALALEDTGRVIPLQRTPSAVSAQLLLYAGRLSEARHRLTAVRQRAIDRGDESDLSYFLSLLAWLETQAGNLVAAEAFAEDATFVASLTGGKSMLPFACTMEALVAAARGDIDRPRSKCDEATLLSRQTNFRLAGEWIVTARCLAELSVDNMVGVWRAAERVTGYWEANPIRGPVGMWFLPDVLEALIALGELDRATTFLGPFQASAERLDRVWGLATSERCCGLLLAARGDLSRAVDHFQKALTYHAQLDMPFAFGRTLLCLGRVYRRRKLRRDAREALSRALEIFERIGTPLWAAKTRAELDRTHIREAPLGLTPSEQTVAELAASGLTNKQIAKQLFISPRTVESNLARIYAKLRIGSRAELGARMATPAARE